MKRLIGIIIIQIFLLAILCIKYIGIEVFSYVHQKNFFFMIEESKVHLRDYADWFSNIHCKRPVK